MVEAEAHETRTEGIGKHRGLFHMPEDIAYFNTASMAPSLRSVHGAGEVALDRVQRPWEISSDAWFRDVERLRGAFAQLIGSDPDAVAFVPSSSYGLAVAARNIEAAPADEVVVLAEEFPSGYYTWQRFCGRTGATLVEIERDERLGWTESVLARISERTRVVAVPHVHWTNGAHLDLEVVARSAHGVGAVLVIDASQSLGALPFDIDAVRPDYLVAVGYKWLLGPLGFSYLYVADSHREGEPLEENWINRAGSESFSSLVDYAPTYRPGARRFDYGEHTGFTLVPMAGAAIDQLLEWGVPRVASALSVVTTEICRRAEALGLAVPSGSERGPHMLGLEVPQPTALRLGEELEKRGVIASVRGNSLRLAPHLHVTHDDIDRLIEGVAAAL
jgi:selenocysteine lyase/cysteine desulfurase